MGGKAKNMEAKAKARKAVGVALALHQTTRTSHLKYLNLHEAVEYAMRPMDVSGVTHGHRLRTEKQYVSFTNIWRAVQNHPDLGEPGHPALRRNKDAVRRAIKANQFIRREGATKGARYFYDSSLDSEKLKRIIPIVMGEIMRTHTSYNNKITSEVLCLRLGYTDANNVFNALSNLEKNGAIDGYLGDGSRTTGYKKIELKPKIWKFNPSGKETYNFTLSEPTSDIFADILLNLKHPDNQTKWVDMFGAIPLPEGRISKSLVVEIALWNLYHSLSHPQSSGLFSPPPDILRDSTLRTYTPELTPAAALVGLRWQGEGEGEGERLSERDKSGGVDQSALEALVDDEEFKDLVARLTLTYLNEKKD